MYDVNRRILALLAGMAAGAGLGILLSSIGKKAWAEKFGRLLGAGDSLKRIITYRVSSVLEKSGLSDNSEFDYYEDYMSSP